jgi:hypothetical protein
LGDSMTSKASLPIALPEVDFVFIFGFLHIGFDGLVRFNLPSGGKASSSHRVICCRFTSFRVVMADALQAGVTLSFFLSPTTHKVAATRPHS